jgi:hypothetical protein
MNQPTHRQSPPDSAAYALRLAMFRVALAPPGISCTPTTFDGPVHFGACTMGGFTGPSPITGIASLALTENISSSKAIVAGEEIRTRMGVFFKASSLTTPLFGAACSGSSADGQYLRVVPGTSVLAIGLENACSRIGNDYVRFNATSQSMGLATPEDATYRLKIGGPISAWFVGNAKFDAKVGIGTAEDLDYNLKVAGTGVNSAWFMGNVRIDGTLRAASSTSPLTLGGSVTLGSSSSDVIRFWGSGLFEESVTFRSTVRIERGPFIVENFRTGFPPMTPSSTTSIVARVTARPPMMSFTTPVSALAVEAIPSGGGDPIKVFDVFDDGKTIVGGEFVANNMASFNGSVFVDGPTDLNDGLIVNRTVTAPWTNSIISDITGADPSHRNTAKAFSVRNAGVEVFHIYGNGNLTAGGNIRSNGRVCATEFNVTTTGACVPDYVFEPEYKLPTLQSTEQYIQANRHLPGVPSAKALEANGMNLAEMNLILLQKIEELTLHMIAQQKRIDQLEKCSTTNSSTTINR